MNTVDFEAISDIPLVTGTDDTLLGNVFMLLEATSRLHPGFPVHVCDFGLSHPARRFLDALGVLRPRPNLPRIQEHPWYAKAAIGDFVTDFHPNATGFIWIDADMLPLRSFVHALSQIIAQMKQEDRHWAVCPDSNRTTLDEFITEWEKRGKNLTLFKSALKAPPLTGQEPYLNIGLLICTSLQAARQWRDVSLRHPFGFCFEQNCFNALAHATPDKVHLLETSLWNPHGALLDTILTIQDDPAFLMHATSIGDRHKEGMTALDVNTMRLDINLKLVLSRSLREKQVEALGEFLKKHGPLMKDVGLLKPHA